MVDEYKTLHIPYKYIIPLNISVLNELQNLSSYYTDTGFLRFLFFVLIIVGTIYLLTKYRVQTAFPYLLHPYPFALAMVLTTLGGWVIWRVVASAILRYGIGLIAWTLMSVLTLGYVIYKELTDTENQGGKILFVAISLCL